MKGGSLSGAGECFSLCFADLGVFLGFCQQDILEADGAEPEMPVPRGIQAFPILWTILVIALDFIFHAKQSNGILRFKNIES